MNCNVVIAIFIHTTINGNQFFHFNEMKMCNKPIQLILSLINGILKINNEMDCFYSVSFHIYNSDGFIENNK